MLTKTVTVTDPDGSVIEHSVVPLLTYAELKAKADPGVEDAAIERARDWLAQANLEMWDGEFEVDDICGALLPMVGISVWRSNQWDVDWSVGDHREEFVINKADVDADLFLAALKRWAADEDAFGRRTERKVSAGPRYQWRLDLRTRDARIIREEGIMLHRVGHWTPQVDIDLGDHAYEDVTPAFKEAANEFIGDITNECLRILRDEYEYQWSEEALDYFADANGYTFTITGKREY